MLRFEYLNKMVMDFPSLVLRKFDNLAHNIELDLKKYVGSSKLPDLHKPPLKHPEKNISHKKKPRSNQTC
jgi:hypothetical protein